MAQKKVTLDGSLSDGTLSPTDFVAASNAFVNKWKSISHDLPPWSWVSCKSTPFASYDQVDGYVTMEKMCVFKSVEVNNGKATKYELGKPSCLSEEDLEDDATLVKAFDQSGCEVHYYDFHIVYSSSYMVPVLYFRGNRSDGLPLVLDEIEKDLPTSSSTLLKESKWTFITQTEHPYMNRLWFMLHPCETNELMRLLLEGDKLAISDQKYLISWLSVVGQVVGIKFLFKWEFLLHIRF